MRRIFNIQMKGNLISEVKEDLYAYGIVYDKSDFFEVGYPLETSYTVSLSGMIKVTVIYRGKIVDGIESIYVNASEIGQHLNVTLCAFIPVFDSNILKWRDNGHTS